jgi:hypothetical protein
VVHESSIASTASKNEIDLTYAVKTGLNEQLDEVGALTERSLKIASMRVSL